MHRYGDLYPKSVLGRAFAVAWFLFGVIINGLFISTLTSVTSVAVIEETIKANPGKIIGVIRDTPEEYYVNVAKTAGGTGEEIEFQRYFDHSFGSLQHCYKKLKKNRFSTEYKS